MSTLPKSHSVRSAHKPSLSASTFKTVVTSPPWARDEPPSPTEGDPVLLSPTAHSFGHRASSSRRSNSPADASSSSTAAHLKYGTDDGPSWWTFTRKYAKDGPPALRGSAKPNWPVISGKLKSRAWLSSRRNSREVPQEDDQQQHDSDEEEEGHRHHRWDFHIPMPAPAAQQFTLSHAKTPGWDSPWSPRAPNPARFGDIENGNGTSGSAAGGVALDPKDDFDGLRRRPTSKRKRRFRNFILTNAYVPLLFRVINIIFTTAALAVAVRVRMLELRYHIGGAVGSSPTIVVIFAPLTLVHVMAAIYLEYFGRPLGLWRTSMKLAHTLSETVFICVWSAALSLSFDNFFTSIIGCASPSSISWYNQIPRPLPNLPDLGRHEGGVADRICDDQLALICLVAVGLVMYCSNLVISLFRIFEKVKYQGPSMTVL
ncbi:hypothetical protein BD410DRAFT_780881 [Rickenella mellea]|uniref:Uncharacterized protein n=1 Tax=Rickenella mellea TaxID=50990 RepID=A0A4Y7QNC6_9AGAM|nr:hypothetical protein BD410DRAFT_780881 [Rickenella mellea]